MAAQFARLAKNISSPVNEIAFNELLNQTTSDMGVVERIIAVMELITTAIHSRLKTMSTTP